MKPREKMERNGIGVLSYADLLALVLRTGSQKSDVFATAAYIAERYPLSVLKNCTAVDLHSFPGLNAAKAASVLAAVELGQRISNEDSHHSIESPEDCLSYLLDIRKLQKEHFVVLYLNSRSQLIHKEVISIGTINASIVHPREVFEPAVRCAATTIIVAHNHPSGTVEPSDADIAVTRRLSQAGEIMGISMLDHVIVSQSKWFSFRKKGMIKERYRL